MAALLHLILIATTIYVTSSENITCPASSYKCEWYCSEANCTNNIYHCPSTASFCTLKCHSCNNLTIYSSANSFSIQCIKPTGCSNIEITAELHSNAITLECDSSDYCDGITFNCPSNQNGHSNCLCIDWETGYNFCSSQVYSSSKNPTKHPSVSPLKLTQNPTDYPTNNPLKATQNPTENPLMIKVTQNLSNYPTENPLKVTQNPSNYPTENPLKITQNPSNYATENPIPPIDEITSTTDTIVIEGRVPESTMDISHIDEKDPMSTEKESMFHLIWIGIAIFLFVSMIIAILFRIYTNRKSKSNISEGKHENSMNDSEQERISIDKIEVEGVETNMELQICTAIVNNVEEKVSKSAYNIEENVEGIRISPDVGNDEIEQMYKFKQNETIGGDIINYNTPDEDMSLCVDDIDLSESKPLPVSPLPGEISIDNNDPQVILEKIWNNRPSVINRKYME